MLSIRMAGGIEAIRQGTDALLAGRFGECERLAAQAVAADPGEIDARLLAVASYREQGRVAEAEILLRDLPPARSAVDQDIALVMLAAVLADLGRDTDAARQLDLVDLGVVSLPACALAAEAVAALRLRQSATTLQARLAPHASTSVGFHGSVARHLGLVTHVLGDWSDAAEHFDFALRANRDAGAPMLVAHTCRHYAAVLRLRGRDSDWEESVDLLACAADIYRRLDIDVRAEDAEAVLRRSLDVADPGASPAVDGDVFRHGPSGWQLYYCGHSAQVADGPGLVDIAALVAAPGRPLHVIDLVGRPTEGVLAADLGAQCRSRLDELNRYSAPDPVAAALAQAERDQLEAELATLAEGAPAAREMGDRARRLVGTRLRVALEQIDAALPALARHLRRSIRTGTFCAYEPFRSAEARAETFRRFSGEDGP